MQAWCMIQNTNVAMVFNTAGNAPLFTPPDTNLIQNGNNMPPDDPTSIIDSTEWVTTQTQ